MTGDKVEFTTTTDDEQDTKAPAKKAPGAKAADAQDAKWTPFKWDTKGTK